MREKLLEMISYAENGEERYCHRTALLLHANHSKRLSWQFK